MGGGFLDGRWDDITLVTDRPSLQVSPGAGQAGRQAEGMGVMGRLFPCFEVLHKHPQPCTHPHGY